MTEREEIEALRRELSAMQRRVHELEQHGSSPDDRLQHVLNASHVVLYAANADKDFATNFISDNVEAVFGYKASDFIDTVSFWSDRIHPDERESTLATLDTLLAAGHIILEYRFLHGDGTYRWIHDEQTLSRDKDGNVVEILGVMQDFTERKNAELTIQQQAAAIAELSTPLIPIREEILVMPLIGLVDSRRAQQIVETLLRGISGAGAKVAILDITGVPVVDTQVANALLQTARAVKLLGAEVVLTGIRPDVARMLVELGVELGSIITRATLQAGIAYSMGKANGKAGR
jgi:rsbT co-antagonist protein RsbR